MYDNRKWDYRFLKLAEHIASWSKDPSSKCGAVIADVNRIVSVGYNGFPVGCDDDDILYGNRDIKLQRTIHAEMNAILFAGHKANGCIIYTWPMFPCDRCVPHIIQAGIKRVVSILPSEELEERWGGSIYRSKKMLDEADLFWSEEETPEMRRERKKRPF